MPKYICRVTRYATDVAEVTVEADTEEMAQLKALEAAKESTDLTVCDTRWELDDVLELPA